MPSDFDRAPFEVDHVVPEKMSGPTVASNLALACFKCNNHKGPNIAGIDPETGEKEFLFDP